MKRQPKLLAVRLAVLAVLCGCSERETTPTGLEGFAVEIVPTEGAPGSTFKITFPADPLANTHLILVNDRWNRFVFRIAWEKVGVDGALEARAKMTEMWSAPPPGGTLPAESRYAVLVASPDPSPTKEELEALFPDPVLREEAADPEIADELRRLIGQLKTRFPDCLVQLEKFETEALPLRFSDSP